MEKITINHFPLQVKEYNGQRVVTFKDIDSVHQRPNGTASRNFKANRKHFIEKEDFFLVKPADIQKDEIRPSEINNRGTILLTESGYLMLVKSFTDDLAWDVQRQLVNSYFRLKDVYKQLSFDDEPEYEYFDKILTLCTKGKVLFCEFFSSKTLDFCPYLCYYICTDK